MTLAGIKRNKITVTHSNRVAVSKGEILEFLKSPKTLMLISFNGERYLKDFIKNSDKSKLVSRTRGITSLEIYKDDAQNNQL